MIMSMQLTPRFQLTRNFARKNKIPQEVTTSKYDNCSTILNTVLRRIVLKLKIFYASRTLSIRHPQTCRYRQWTSSRLSYNTCLRHVLTTQHTTPADMVRSRGQHRSHLAAVPHVLLPHHVVLCHIMLCCCHNMCCATSCCAPTNASHHNNETQTTTVQRVTKLDSNHTSRVYCHFFYLSSLPT